MGNFLFLNFSTMKTSIFTSGQPDSCNYHPLSEVLLQAGLSTGGGIACNSSLRILDRNWRGSFFYLTCFYKNRERILFLDFLLVMNG